MRGHEGLDKMIYHPINWRRSIKWIQGARLQMKKIGRININCCKKRALSLLLKKGTRLDFGMMFAIYIKEECFFLIVRERVSIDKSFVWR
jgi:hypothetical protein